MGRIPNDELLRKAIITAADALASNGKLNDEQSNRFIDYVIDETVLRNNARIIKFTPENLDIDKIGVGTRVALPKTEAVAPTIRRGVTTSKVTLTPKEICVPFEISDVFSEINIEGGSVEDHVIRMMATQMANDIEELYLNGNTLGAHISENEYTGAGSTTQMIKDNYLALVDGWLKLALGGNQYLAGGTNIGASVFSGMLKALPEKFKRNRGNLRFFISTDLEQNWREKVSTRATGSGDDALSSGGVLTPFGVPLVPVPLFAFQPTIVVHMTFSGDGGTIQLPFAPVADGSTVITLSTLAGVPTTPYVEDTDYTVADATGIITHIVAGSGGNITHTDELKISVQVNPQLILTHMANFIVGIGRDIRIEKDRDIFKGVNQYAVTGKVAVEFEEDTALVFGKNIGLGV